MVNIKNISSNPMLIENITNAASAARRNNLRRLQMNINRAAQLEVTGFRNAAMTEYNKRMNNLKSRKNKLTTQYKNLMNKQSEKQRYIASYANVPNKNEVAAMRRGNVALRGAMRMIRSNLVNVNKSMYSLAKNRNRIQQKANTRMRKAIVNMKARVANQMHKTSRKAIAKKSANRTMKKSAISKRASGLNKLFRIR